MSDRWNCRKTETCQKYQQSDRISQRPFPASQENWDKAQVLMANNLLIIGAAELVITLIVYAVTQNLPDDQTSILTIVLVALQTLGVVLVIPLVESKLG